MTDIEELVRSSLRSAPAVVPSSSDPVAAVSGRVRRARALWGGGIAAVVAVLVAAVVVPLSMRDSGAGRVVPADPSPSASPVPSADARGVTVWDTDAVAATSGGGYLWELRQGHAPQAQEIVKLDPTTHHQLGIWKIAHSGESIGYGGDVIWVWTHSTHGGDMVTLGQGLVQAVDLATGTVGSYAIGPLDAMDEVAMLPNTQTGDALAAIGSSIRQLQLENGTIRVLGTMPLPGGDSGGTSYGPIVSTQAGNYWVFDAGHLLQLDVRTGPFDELKLREQPSDSVPWDGSLVGTAGPDSVWTYDGSRLVSLTPSLLHQGASVAQGDRIPVPGYPVAVVSDGNGGIYVSVEDTQVPIPGARPGLYHVTAAAIARGDGVVGSTPALADVPTQLAPDGHGGVDFVTVDGAAEHWGG